MVNGKHIAIIPARGGSKRIPRKNLVDFAGKPMIVWSIEAAILSECFDRVLVSTDDEEIAAVARAAGASVPFLRTEAADDYTPVSAATLAALGQVATELGEHYEYVTQLMPNCPLRTSATIVAMLDRIEAQAPPSMISCFRFGWMNPWWAVTLDDCGHPRRLFTDAASTRSQDLPRLYCPTGAVWVAQTSALTAERSFYTTSHVFHEIPWSQAVDIDDKDDLEFARLIASSHSTNGGSV